MTTCGGVVQGIILHYQSIHVLCKEGVGFTFSPAVRMNG